MIALTNETQTMLSFPRIFKFNTVMYYPLLLSYYYYIKKILLYLFYV